MGFDLQYEIAFGVQDAEPVAEFVRFSLQFLNSRLQRVYPFFGNCIKEDRFNMDIQNFCAGSFTGNPDRLVDNAGGEVIEDKEIISGLQ